MFIKMLSFNLLLISVLLCYNVHSSVLHEPNKQVTKTYISPVQESYVAIPVAIVFEDVNRQDKSLNHEEYESNNKTSSDSEIVKIEKSSTVQGDYEKSSNESNNNDEKIIAEEKFDNNTEIHISHNKNTTEEHHYVTDSAGKVVDEHLKPNLDTELQIPVVVIYDEPPIPLSTKPNHQNGIRKIRNRQKFNGNSRNERYEKQHNAYNNTNLRHPSKQNRKRDPVTPIVQSENYVYSHSGDFHYSYESGDGTKAYERGELRSNNENAGEAVVGSFSYVGKDGNDYSLSYTADENGYRPVGAHLPTPPPIPPAIARALKYLASKSTPEPINI